MTNYKQLKIKDYPIDIIDGDRGVNYPNKSQLLKDGYCLFLNTSNVTLDGFKFSKNEFISKEKDNSLRKGKLHREDVILTTRGTIGNIAHYQASTPHENVRINSGMVIIRSHTSKVDPRFLYFLLKSPVFQEQAKLFSYGAAQPQLPIGTLKYIKLPIPLLPTQQKIAKILSNYDDLIENNLKRIKLLEESARLTYEEWFLRFRIDGKKLDIDPESDLPFGWEKISLSDTGEFLNGYAFKPKDLQEEGLPVIKIKEMKAGVVKDTPRNPGDKIDDKYLVLRGDILFSWSATLEVIQWQYANGWLNQHLFKVSPNSDFPKSFLYLSLRNSLYIFDYLTTGATMKHIKRKELDFVKIPTPSSDILLKFDNLVNPMLEEILNLSHQNQLLKEARDILLPRLMTGMIDTDDMDIAV